MTKAKHGEPKWLIDPDLPEAFVQVMKDMADKALEEQGWNYLVLVKDPARLLAPSGLWQDMDKACINGWIELTAIKGLTFTLPLDLFCNVLNKDVAIFVSGPVHFPED